MKRTPQSNLMFATLFLGALLTGCAAMPTQETQYPLDTRLAQERGQDASLARSAISCRQQYEEEK
ncbi:MAG: hypothetical protein ACREXX_09400 [Gammaproteobacteria bacterium]